MPTVADIRAKIDRWMLEPVDPDLAIDTINAAIESLWGSLLEADVGDKISRQPYLLTADTDIIPFDEYSAGEFLVCYCLVPLCNLIHEYPQAAMWEARAEGASPRPAVPGGLRQAAIKEVLQKSIRQSHITPYQPSGNRF